MDTVNEFENLTHAYRKQLAEIERRAGRSDQATVNDPFKTTGEQRQAIERMDADLTALEYKAQAKALEERLAKLERTPVHESRAPKSVPVARDTESADYANRWFRAVVSGDQAEMRAMSTSTTAAAVPTDMERRIINRMYQASVLRQISNVTTIDSKRTITIEASSPSATIIGEGSAVTPADFTFAAVSVAPVTYRASTTMSQQFIEDSIGTNGIGSAVDWATERLGVSLARGSDEGYTIGNPGANPAEPQGIGSTQSTNWATTNTGRIINQGVALTEDDTVDDMTADNVIDLVHAVPPQYRTGERFRILLSDAALKAVRKMKDTTGYYLFSPAASINATNVVGLPGTIYGVPYSVSAYLPSTAAQTGTGTNVRGSALMIAGNFEYFGIFDRTGITAMIDPYTASVNLQTTLHVYLRTDSKILLPEAFAAIYAPNAS